MVDRRAAPGGRHVPGGAGALPNEKARPLVLARQLDKVAALTKGLPQNLATLREALEVQDIVEAILRA
jgi:hypothetical protein